MASSVIVQIEFVRNDHQIRLYNRDDDHLEAIMDAYWEKEYGKDDFPSMGYSPLNDADVYTLTAEQLIAFLAERLEVSDRSKKASKKPATVAQRAARAENARRATAARIQRQNNIPQHTD